MELDKIVTININEGALDKGYWGMIDKLCGKRISLPKGSPAISKEVSDADALLIGFGVPVDKQLIDGAKKLKYIGAYSTAYGTVDVDQAHRRGITVANVPGYATESVAEFVFGCIIETLRELERAKSEARKGNYSEEGFTATEIKGKRFGIVGAGRIGTKVAEIASSFGADVRYWSRNRKSGLEAKGIKYEELDRLLSGSDVISNHLALTKDTEDFLNSARVRKMKKDVVFINTAPMEIVDIPAVVERLQKNDMIFILDHSDEMKAPDLATLSKYKNCIIYPPIGCITKESRINKQGIFVDNLNGFLAGKPQNVV
jgi:phosphoglycerate dehydrogenase-like enzyme